MFDFSWWRTTAALDECPVHDQAASCFNHIAHSICVYMLWDVSDCEKVQLFSELHMRLFDEITWFHSLCLSAGLAPSKRFAVQIVWLDVCYWNGGKKWGFKKKIKPLHHVVTLLWTMLKKTEEATKPVHKATVGKAQKKLKCFSATLPNPYFPRQHGNLTCKLCPQQLLWVPH